jgi:hypothetical protein
LPPSRRSCPSAAHRAEHALRRAIVAVVGIMGVTNEAAITGASASQPVKVPIWPWNWPMAALTSGTRAARHRSLTIRRVLKLSLPSMTTSTFCKISAELCSLNAFFNSVKYYIRIKARDRGGGGFYLGLADLRLAKSTCRCRFESETTSSSSTR